MLKEVNWLNGDIRRDKLPTYIRGDGESDGSFMQRIRSSTEYIEKGPLGAHFAWYTHRNPAGCWICDLATLVHVCMRDMQRVYEREVLPGGEALSEEEAVSIYGEVPLKDLEKTSD